MGKGNTAVVPLSLCIVTNRWDARLEEIIRVCSASFAEILIGYDGRPETIPASFAAYKNTRIVPLQWEGYSTTKNTLAAKAVHPWILSLDGDEVPDPQLLRAIAGLAYANLPTGTIYTFKRLSFFEGKKIKYGAWGRDRVLRLYNKTYTQWNQDIVHEALEIKPGTKVLPLDGVLLHYTADTYASFLEKNKRYALLSAAKYFERGKRSPLWKRLLSPAFTFVREYVFEAGFMDGSAGFKIARINALYTHWKYAFLKERYQESAS